MKKNICFCSLLGLLLMLPVLKTPGQVVQPIAIADSMKTLNSQWNHRRVAFLGDSMTDKKRVGTTCVYWEYLASLLNIQPLVYGIDGNTWTGIARQATKLLQERGQEVDAILIFAGTNDFNGSLPMGTFFSVEPRQVNHDGQMVTRQCREQIMTDTTFCGRINIAMSFLKKNYPSKQIILLTPIHRGLALFGEKNVQPDESYSNARGLYIEDYVKALKEAGEVWAVPVIDLYSLSGLYPSYDSYAPYFHDGQKDRLHPNAAGDLRIAQTLQYQLLTLP
jgi:lysophospholipase L1-like esterase